MAAQSLGAKSAGETSARAAWGGPDTDMHNEAQWGWGGGEGAWGEGEQSRVKALKGQDWGWCPGAVAGRPSEELEKRKWRVWQEPNSCHWN